MPIAEPEAPGESTGPTDAETQHHLLALRVTIVGGAMDGAWGHRGGLLVGLLRLGLWVPFLGPIARHRRRILLDPRRREGRESEGFARHSTKHPVQVGGTQRLQDLAPTVSVAGCSLEPWLEQGHHPALLQAWAHFIERMMAVQDRQDHGFHAAAAGEERGRMGREQRVDDGRHLQLAHHAQHQREMGYGTYLTDINRHDASPQVARGL
jgi:hypothetical protein